MSGRGGREGQGLKERSEEVPLCLIKQGSKLSTMLLTKEVIEFACFDTYKEGFD